MNNEKERAYLQVIILIYSVLLIYLICINQILRNKIDDLQQVKVNNVHHKIYDELKNELYKPDTNKEYHTGIYN